MLFQIEFIVAPNPSVAIFGPIKAAANTANNPTIIGIGFMFMTALRMPWAVAIPNVAPLASAITAFSICIGFTTAIVAKNIAPITMLIPIITARYANIANWHALVTAVIAIMPTFCTVKLEANAIDAIRTPTKYPAKPISNTPKFRIACDGAVNIPFNIVPVVLNEDTIPLIAILTPLKATFNKAIAPLATTAIACIAIPMPSIAVLKSSLAVIDESSSMTG